MDTQQLLPVEYRGSRKPEQTGQLPTNVHSVRRVTGSSNIPISPDGKKQAVQMTKRFVKTYDHVFCGPEDRSIETAKYFGDPIVLKGLEAWYRGSHEGKPADEVKGAMRGLILHPNVKPPGVSPISGKPGKSYGDFLKRLMRVMRTIEEHFKRGEHILIVTSGGDLQAIDHFKPLGFPEVPKASDLAELAKKPYWSATGTLFELGDKGIDEIQNNSQSGINLMEHFATDFNPPDAKDIPKTVTEGRKFSSTQMNLPEGIAKHVRAFAAKIPKEHLAQDGVEDRPHVTVLYGIHSDKANDTQKALRDQKAVTLHLKHASIFSNPEHDVLKMDVHSPELHKLNAHLKDHLQHTETHPEYKPHATIAYLKPGEGKKYVGTVIPGATWKKIAMDHVVFSPKDSEKTDIPLKK